MSFIVARLSRFFVSPAAGREGGRASPEPAKSEEPRQLDLSQLAITPDYFAAGAVRRPAAAAAAAAAAATPTPAPAPAQAPKEAAPAEVAPEVKTSQQGSAAVRSSLFEYESGACYHGEWKDDMPHGYGTYIWENGDTYDGAWWQFKRNGLGVHTEESRTYDGWWVDDKREGFGVQFYANHTVYEGTWANDLMDGQFIVTVAGCYREVGQWKLDKRQGQHVRTYFRNKPVEIIEYRDGHQVTP